MPAAGDGRMLLVGNAASACASNNSLMFRFLPVGGGWMSVHSITGLIGDY